MFPDDIIGIPSGEGLYKHKAGDSPVPLNLKL